MAFTAVLVAGLLAAAPPQAPKPDTAAVVASIEAQGGDVGRDAIRRFLGRATELGYIEKDVELEFVS